MDSDVENCYFGEVDLFMGCNYFRFRTMRETTGSSVLYTAMPDFDSNTHAAINED